VFHRRPYGAGGLLRDCAGPSGQGGAASGAVVAIPGDWRNGATAGGLSFRSTRVARINEDRDALSAAARLLLSLAMLLSVDTRLLLPSPLLMSLLLS